MLTYEVDGTQEEASTLSSTLIAFFPFGVFQTVAHNTTGATLLEFLTDEYKKSYNQSDHYEKIFIVRSLVEFEFLIRLVYDMLLLGYMNTNHRITLDVYYGQSSMRSGGFERWIHAIIIVTICDCLVFYVITRHALNGVMANLDLRKHKDDLVEARIRSPSDVE